MNKIGILTCIHSNNVCARVGCLAAFQNRTDFFQDYPEDTSLAAMMTCNGCKYATEIQKLVPRLCIVCDPRTCRSSY